ncbi:MAG: serine--tRNA ligase [Methanobacteriota archaeon]|nr:MAG: serine--tRNA ligase [Euryarchaeota archaeon]|tara:strand:+ start:1311 stop:2594 length:1284 start_codon:yes stop_codon:yes gene_type:complete
MLDISEFRDNDSVIRADHDKRKIPHNKIDKVIQLDEEWRRAVFDQSLARKKRNDAAKLISNAKKAGNSEEMKKLLAEVKDLGTKIEDLDYTANQLIEKRDAIRMTIPNILHNEVPIGDDEKSNTLHSEFGKKPEFSFSPRTHNELLEINKWAELPRAAKITGSRFYFLKGDLARLEMALQSYTVDFMLKKEYTLIHPPTMMNRKAYEGVTDLGDFETVMYGVQPDGYYMIATSEHPLTAMYMDEIIEPSILPIKLVGVSPCFRREVGAHGQSDKGIWRVHQFTKIEQIIISHPDDSWNFHEEMLENCIELWNSLGIHYRVVNICTGDMGTVASRKYDLEAWLPGPGEYKEIVSCSNCTDYQANRLRMRFRTPDGNSSVHTLNSTAVATSRALVAIMEQYQLEDGRVNIPKVLQAYMNGQKIIEPTII